MYSKAHNSLNQTFTLEQCERNTISVHHYTSKTWEGMHCSVVEGGMMSLSFQTAQQKKEAKLSYFVQFENKMASYHAL